MPPEEENVSAAERLGFILLAGTVGAAITVLVAHTRIESALDEMWRDAGGAPGLVTFRGQAAFLTTGGEVPPELDRLPITRIYPAE